MTKQKSILYADLIFLVLIHRSKNTSCYSTIRHGEKIGHNPIDLTILYDDHGQTKGTSSNKSDCLF